MDKSLFRYIWRNSRRDQLAILFVVVASLPFYFASLDLPRQIVNQAIQGRAFEGGRATAPFFALSFTWPTWLGGSGEAVPVFEGIPLDRLSLLLALSGLFLLLVLVNGAFKYWINVAKGALGERMLRRMRFELFSLVLRFSPEALRTVKSSETATIIKDEVEPIGGFIGDAFTLPAFLGLQAITALVFILVQSFWLGLIAVAVIGVQFVVIPRLRRELLRLGRERQLASRRLAGRVAEVMDGIEAVHVHNAHAWERAEIGHRLYGLFDLRFRIFKRKFMVKFMNNLLAQLTPFLFYVVGGYFALRGELDIGQLVAVIGAYRELPPPLKELIDWDQMRLDVQVKYDQITEHFAPDRLTPPERPDGEAVKDAALVGALAVTGLVIRDQHGAPIVEGVHLVHPLPARIALVGDGSPAAGAFARVLARRAAAQEGSISIGERDLAGLTASALGERVSYAGVEPVLFPGSIRDNLLYGLRRRPLGRAPADARAEARRILEAKRTGNPVERLDDVWIDLDRHGAKTLDEIDDRLVEVLCRVGLGDDLYRFGLAGRIDPGRHERLGACVIEARRRLRETLRQAGASDLVEPFDPKRYNTQASIGENLLFGVPTSATLAGRGLAGHAETREVLDRLGLTDDLLRIGERIAETMTEIFRGLPSNHPLFEQFSFISAEELADFDAILRARAGRAGRLTRHDRTRLLALPLDYIEARHRLGLLDEPLRDRIVAARPEIRRALEAQADPGLEFYDEDRVLAAAPLRDNLLFGRVSQRLANASTRVFAFLTEVLETLDLREEIQRVGLDQPVGPAGRLLSAQQRALINLGRCLVKRPDILVLDGAFAPFGEERARALLATVLEMSRESTLVAVVPNGTWTRGFDVRVRFADGRAVVETDQPAHDEAVADPPEPAKTKVAADVP